MFFHHIFLLTFFAPRLNCHAWVDKLSVLSTSNSMRSPRERILNDTGNTLSCQ